MKIAANRWGAAFCVVGALVAGAAAAEPTLSLRVTEINGIALPEPTAQASAQPGDTVTVAIYVSDWSPAGQRLGGYQATIDFDGYLTGDSGNVFPMAFANTTDLNGRCTAGGESGEPNPDNAFVDLGHPSFVFTGLSALAVTDTVSCDYRYLGVLMQTSDGPISSQDGTRYYCGSLMLQVSEDASGTFTLGFADEGLTYMRDSEDTGIEPLILDSAAITVDSSPPAPSETGSFPPDGAIDARQPSDGACVEAYGWSWISIPFDDNASGVHAANFTITVDPPDLAPPAITGVTHPTDFDITLEFDQPIPTGHWTIVAYEPVGWTTRLGYLPADVNGDGTASPADILALIDSLNGVGPDRELWSTDVNRSGEATPADILSVVDLLNGAGCFEPWNGEALPE